MPTLNNFQSIPPQRTMDPKSYMSVVGRLEKRTRPLKNKKQLGREYTNITTVISDNVIDPYNVILRGITNTKDEHKRHLATTIPASSMQWSAR